MILKIAGPMGTPRHYVDKDNVYHLDNDRYSAKQMKDSNVYETYDNNKNRANLFQNRDDAGLVAANPGARIVGGAALGTLAGTTIGGLAGGGRGAELGSAVGYVGGVLGGALWAKQKAKNIMIEAERNRQA